jgi:hypothetical protein
VIYATFRFSQTFGVDPKAKRSNISSQITVFKKQKKPSVVIALLILLVFSLSIYQGYLPNPAKYVRDTHDAIYQSNRMLRSGIKDVERIITVLKNTINDFDHIKSCHTLECSNQAKEAATPYLDYWTSIVERMIQEDPNSEEIKSIREAFLTISKAIKDFEFSSEKNVNFSILFKNLITDIAYHYLPDELEPKIRNSNSLKQLEDVLELAYAVNKTLRGAMDKSRSRLLCAQWSRSLKTQSPPTHPFR